MARLLPSRALALMPTSAVNGGAQHAHALREHGTLLKRLFVPSLNLLVHVGQAELHRLLFSAVVLLALAFAAADYSFAAQGAADGGHDGPLAERFLVLADDYDPIVQVPQRVPAGGIGIVHAVAAAAPLGAQ